MSIRFTDLVVWQKSRALIPRIYGLTARYPSSERFGLISQMRRAVISIPANIAEGQCRATLGEYLNQISVARGSAGELETLLFVSEDLEYARSEDLCLLREDLDHIQRMITRLRQQLSR